MKWMVVVLLSLSTTMIPGAATAATASDLRDYALACCLTKQTASRDLQAEGYHLADVVLARAGVGALAWRPLDMVVAAALARRGLLMVHVDGPVAQATQPAPLASCLLVIDSPSVRTVMRN